MMKKIANILISILLVVLCLPIHNVCAINDVELDIRTTAKNYHYVDGIKQGDNDLEEDYALSISYDSESVTYTVEVLGDVEIHNNSAERGIFITGGNLKVIGNGTLTIIIDEGNCATVFETKRKEYGNLVVGSDNPNDRLKIKVICEANTGEINPHNIRVFRPMLSCTFQNSDIELVGANQLMETPGANVTFNNCRVIQDVIYSSYGAEDNSQYFITGANSVNIINSDIAMKSSNPEDFSSDNYDRYMSCVFGVGEVIIDNSSFNVDLPIYSAARNTGNFEIKNNSTVNITTLGSSFEYPELTSSNPASFSLNDSSLTITSKHGCCFEGEVNVSLIITDDNLIDMQVANGKQIFGLSDDPNLSVHIVHPENTVNIETEDGQSMESTEEINWSYEDVKGEKSFVSFTTDVFNIIIRFFGNGGIPVCQTVCIDKANVPDFFDAPERVIRLGYKFLGWGIYDEDDELNGPIIDFNDINKDTSVYAMWQECSHNNLSIIEAALPTATQKGYIKHYQCQDCGMYFYYKDGKLKEIENYKKWLDDPENGGAINIFFDDEPTSLTPSVSGTVVVPRDEEIYFDSDTPFDEFGLVMIGFENDPKKASLLDPSKYTLVNNDGKIRVVIDKDYLSTLNTNTYYIFVAYRDGYSMVQFSIKNTKESHSGGSSYIIPKTGIK